MIMGAANHEGETEDTRLLGRGKAGKLSKGLAVAAFAAAVWSVSLICMAGSGHALHRRANKAATEMDEAYTTVLPTLDDPAAELAAGLAAATHTTIATPSMADPNPIVIDGSDGTADLDEPAGVDVMVGAARNEHGCIPSAGYSWDGQACSRPWERPAIIDFEPQVAVEVSSAVADGDLEVQVAEVAEVAEAVAEVVEDTEAVDVAEVQVAEITEVAQEGHAQVAEEVAEVAESSNTNLEVAKDSETSDEEESDEEVLEEVVEEIITHAYQRPAATDEVYEEVQAFFNEVVEDVNAFLVPSTTTADTVPAVDTVEEVQVEAETEVQEVEAEVEVQEDMAEADMPVDIEAIATEELEATGAAEVITGGVQPTTPPPPAIAPAIAFGELLVQNVDEVAPEEVAPSGDMAVIGEAVGEKAIDYTRLVLP